jgi:hypothetical protein
VFSNLTRVAIALSCLLFVKATQAECVGVVSTHPQESSPQVRTAVSFRGKPAKGIKVVFYIYETNEKVFEGQSDENGILVTPKLAGKDYWVFAVLDEAVMTSEWVRVVSAHEANTISLDLTDAYYLAHPEFRFETYKGAEEPIDSRIQKFEGSITDPTGAAVADTKITVLRMGAQYEDFMLALKPDEKGHFAAHLPEGRYIGYFFATGFKAAKKTFEITKDGSGALKIMLPIGSC